MKRETSARDDVGNERSGTECRMTERGGERGCEREAVDATYRVANATRNDFYIPNKWVPVSTLGRYFRHGGANRKRVKESAREREGERERVDR